MRARLRGVIEDHLESHDVARILYGAIIGLALVVALQIHPPSPAKTAAALLGTAIAVGLAEVYSELVGTEAREHRPVARRELRGMVAGAGAVTLGASFPAIFFLLAALGAMDNHLAYTLSKWTGLVLICGYGYLAARLSGAGIARALVHAASVGLVGGALIALKAALH
jgi:VIT1/CCC1 family predicted Fe2+/Mn2+ transporter